MNDVAGSLCSGKIFSQGREGVTDCVDSVAPRNEFSQFIMKIHTRPSSYSVRIVC